MQLQQATNLLREICRLRHFSLKTEKSYAYWLNRYGAFLKDPQFKSQTSEQKMEAFLTHLARQGVSASTQNQAFNALVFFYRVVLKQELGPVDSLRAQRPPALRCCPTQEEVQRLLGAVTDTRGYPTRLIVHLLYGCGFRVTEPLMGRRFGQFCSTQDKGGRGQHSH